MSVFIPRSTDFSLAQILGDSRYRLFETAHKGARWKGLEMSYTYENGCMMVTTDIRYGFKRFKQKNAQYRHTVDNDLMLEQWDFVSYAYPCMSVDHVLDTDSWEVLITRDAFDCSRTTTRQIGDFLRYIGCPITLHDIRDVMSFDDGFSSNFEAEINDDCTVSLMDSVAYRF